MVYHDRVYIFIQLMYNKKRPFGKAVYFCQLFDVFSGFYNPIPKTLSTYVVYVYSDMPFSKGHLGSGGGGEHLMLGLHYVPGSHGSHGSQKRSSP